MFANEDSDIDWLKDKANDIACQAPNNMINISDELHKRR